MRSERKFELRNKGWSEKDIHKAQEILERTARHEVHFSKIVFASALIVTVLGNLLISIVLIPFLIVLNAWVVYSVVVLLAITMGYVYNFLIRDIGHLEKKHHILATILLPIIALGNMFIMVQTSNSFIQELIANGNLQNSPHDPWIIAAVFVIVFIIPYILSSIHRHMKHGHKAVIVK